MLRGCKCLASRLERPRLESMGNSLKLCRADHLSRRKHVARLGGLGCHIWVADPGDVSLLLASHAWLLVPTCSNAANFPSTSRRCLLQSLVMQQGSGAIRLAPEALPSSLSVAKQGAAVRVATNTGPSMCLSYGVQVISPTTKAFLYTWGEGRTTAEGEYIPARCEHSHPASSCPACRSWLGLRRGSVHCNTGLEVVAAQQFLGI